MKRTQRIALLLVVIMLVATVPAIAAAEQPAQTPKVGQYRTPTLTISHTPTYPYRGQTYSVSGYLTDGGTPLAHRVLLVWVMWPRPGVWQWVNAAGLGITASTDANGRYAFATSSGYTEVWWKVKFNGDSVYYAKNAYNQIFPGKTITTISDSSTHNPHTLSGFVRNANGVGIQGIPVKLYIRSVGSTIWVWHRTYITSSTGGWKTGHIIVTRNVECVAVSQGSSIYSPSQSRIITVAA